LGKINVSHALAQAEHTLREDASLSPRVRALMQLLISVIGLLLDRLGLNSRNSSLPPSRDPNRPRGRPRLAPGQKRKPGGQPGHAAAKLEPEPHPDRIESIDIDRRSLPPGRYTEAGFEARQVIDIEISRVVTEYRAQVLKDAAGQRWVAQFPPGVSARVQYGAALKAQAVYMSQQQLVPYERVREYFSDQCGIALSTGSLFNFNQEAFARLADFERIAKRQLIAEAVLHADETGINIDTDGLWLHCVSSAKWTLYLAHPNRGGEAMQAMGVLEHFTGILCHDHWKPYFQFNCQHALCNAHHLRELERAWEQDAQHWAKRMQKLLLDMNTATQKAGGCLSKTEALRWRRRYRNLLTRAERECPPPTPKAARGRPARSKARNLLERLRAYETETLRFMTDPRVPFTNNQGENDIRMTKVQQKISGCFRSFEGAQIFCRVRSYLSTCRKHALAATDALQLLFAGQLPDFIPKLE
jgi:transposase